MPGEGVLSPMNCVLSQRQPERSEIEGEAPQADACGGGDASPAATRAKRD